MNVEIGAEAALFPEKEYINGIAVAVWGVEGGWPRNKRPCFFETFLELKEEKNYTSIKQHGRT
jgi:hypothetical protein